MAVMELDGEERMGSQRRIKRGLAHKWMFNCNQDIAAGGLTGCSPVPATAKNGVPLKDIGVYYFIIKQGFGITGDAMLLSQLLTFV